MSSSNTIDNMQTLNRNSKKCETEEVFQLVLESLEYDIDKILDKILELLIKNQKVKTSCHENKACLSITKEDQINKDNLKEDFNYFKNHNEFESMTQ